MTPTFPTESAQALVGKWWVSAPSKEVCVGRLVRAAIPHVDQVAKMLSATGRGHATIHDSATFRVEPLTLTNYNARTKLPVAGMPAYTREINLVQRAKRRPCLVVGLCGDEIPRAANRGKPNWQTAPTRLIAPYYGVDEGTGDRAGYAASFLRRIQRCEYPQFLWDRVPSEGASESVLRLDQIQAIGRHHNTLEILPWRLSDDAVELLEDRIHWIRHNEVLVDSVLELVQAELSQLATSN